MPRSGPQGAPHKRRLSLFPTSAYRLRDARRDCRLAVACADRSLQLELALGRQTLLAGEWGFDVRRDGAAAAPVSAWEETCREADREVDYLELRIELAGGLTVERHIVVARRDRFALLADAVLDYTAGARRMEHRSVPRRMEHRSVPRRTESHSVPANRASRARRTESHSVPGDPGLAYCATLPLADGVSWQGAKQTREGLLVGRRRALVLPLALREWRAEDSAGELAATDDRCGKNASCGGSTDAAARNGRSETASYVPSANGLQLHQATTGRALFAPLFIDFDARRIARPATWRQLTVGHKGVVQPGDVAVGYRVAVGSRQWIVYRSLAEAASRTLLGHNLNGETLVARFRRNGEVETIIEVE